MQYLTTTFHWTWPISFYNFIKIKKIHSISIKTLSAAQWPIKKKNILFKITIQFKFQTLILIQLFDLTFNQHWNLPYFCLQRATWCWVDMTAASHFWHIWASSLIVTEITFNLDSPATVLQDHASLLPCYWCHPSQSLLVYPCPYIYHYLSFGQ
jgi:hypothetical protein